jgi:hypothetical protein
VRAVGEARPPDADKLAKVFGFLADRDFRGFSPLYEHLARHIATDERIPQLVTDANQHSHAPILFFACVHDIVLREPTSDLARCYAAVVDGADPAATDVWPVFQAMVDERADELDHMLRTREVQTNEVGRSAAIAAGLAALPAHTADRFGVGLERLALVELGASGGLNLCFDRYRIDYGPGTVATGPVDSTVTIDCELRGTRQPPVDRPLPDIAQRVGLDRRPIDITADDDVRWLRACIWPGLQARRARLDAAIDLARHDPPEIRRGDLVDDLDALLDTIDADLPVCLISTWVFAYVTPPRRLELQARLEAAATRRPILLLTAEYEVTPPWVGPAPRRPTIATGDLPTRLALTIWQPEPWSVSLAWMHAHGWWLEWLDDR